MGRYWAKSDYNQSRYEKFQYENPIVPNFRENEIKAKKLIGQLAAFYGIP